MKALWWRFEMFGFLKKKQPVQLTMTLNARLQPMHRGDLEDTLEEVMQKHGHGVRVIGGGTLMARGGEVDKCDTEIELDDGSDEMIETLIGTMSVMLAPKGSYLTIHDKKTRRIDFGVHEGLALYLNGTELADEVYQACDVNHVYNECGRLLGDDGQVASHWQGAVETALYMYGPSFEAMKTRILPFVQEYPLCQKCRIERIA